MEVSELRRSLTRAKMQELASACERMRAKKEGDEAVMHEVVRWEDGDSLELLSTGVCTRSHLRM